jgi:hypothetical protein
LDSNLPSKLQVVRFCPASATQVSNILAKRPFRLANGITPAGNTVRTLAMRLAKIQCSTEQRLPMKSPHKYTSVHPL